MAVVAVVAAVLLPPPLLRTAQRRQPSGMVSGVDSSMMSGIDAEDDGDDDVMGTAATSRELLEFR